MVQDLPLCGSPSPPDHRGLRPGPGRRRPDLAHRCPATGPDSGRPGRGVGGSQGGPDVTTPRPRAGQAGRRGHHRGDRRVTRTGAQHRRGRDPAADPEQAAEREAERRRRRCAVIGRVDEDGLRTCSPGSPTATPSGTRRCSSGSPTPWPSARPRRLRDPRGAARRSLPLARAPRGRHRPPQRHLQHRRQRRGDRTAGAGPGRPAPRGAARPPLPGSCRRPPRRTRRRGRGPGRGARPDAARAVPHPHRTGRPRAQAGHRPQHRPLGQPVRTPRRRQRTRVPPHHRRRLPPRRKSVPTPRQDHPDPYDSTGPPGQTGDHNHAPLGRRTTEPRPTSATKSSRSTTPLPLANTPRTLATRRRDRHASGRAARTEPPRPATPPSPAAAPLSARSAHRRAAGSQRRRCHPRPGPPRRAPSGPQNGSPRRRDNIWVRRSRTTRPRSSQRPSIARRADRRPTRVRRSRSRRTSPAAQAAERSASQAARTLAAATAGRRTRRTRSARRWVCGSDVLWSHVPAKSDHGHRHRRQRDRDQHDDHQARDHAVGGHALSPTRVRRSGALVIHRRPACLPRAFASRRAPRCCGAAGIGVVGGGRRRRGGDAQKAAGQGSRTQRRGREGARRRARERRGRQLRVGEARRCRDRLHDRHPGSAPPPRRRRRAARPRQRP